jgi:hypothetical protein
LNEFCAELNVSLEILISLEDSNDIIFLKRLDILMNFFDYLLQEGNSHQVSMRSKGKSAEDPSALVNIQKVEVLLLSKVFLNTSNQEIQ